MLLNIIKLLCYLDDISGSKRVWYLFDYKSIIDILTVCYTQCKNEEIIQQLMEIILLLNNKPDIQSKFNFCNLIIENSKRMIELEQFKQNCIEEMKIKDQELIVFIIISLFLNRIYVMSMNNKRQIFFQKFQI